MEDAHETQEIKSENKKLIISLAGIYATALCYLTVQYPLLYSVEDWCIALYPIVLFFSRNSNGASDALTQTVIYNMIYSPSISLSGYDIAQDLR